MSDLIAFAYDFMSYLMLRSLEKQPVRRIVLFGSVARGDFDKHSDIDLFIDITSNLSTVRKMVDKAQRDFYLSLRVNKWKDINIKNKINIIVGNLEEKSWEELRRSMSSHGIVLWQSYSGRVGKGKNFILVSWFVKAKEPNKRVKLARKLYGYKRGRKTYTGLLEELGAKQVSQGVALFPVKYTNKLRQVFNEVGVRYRLTNVVL